MIWVFLIRFHFFQNSNRTCVFDLLAIDFSEFRPSGKKTKRDNTYTLLIEYIISFHQLEKNNDCRTGVKIKRKSIFFINIFQTAHPVLRHWVIGVGS